jgi:hypothetical protein
MVNQSSLLMKMKARTAGAIPSDSPDLLVE